METIQSKCCTKCGIEKPKSEFGVLKSSKDGLRYDCKECKRQESVNYRLLNKKPKKINYEFSFKTIICQECSNSFSGNFSHAKKFCSKTCMYKSKNNRQSSKDAKLNYIINNVEKVKKTKTDWIINNPEKIKLSRKKESQKLTTKLKNTLRNRVRKVLKGLSNGHSTLNMLGCNVDEFIKHIEYQFKSDMNWDNWCQYGWHLDHITPLSKAKSKEEMLKLCHYTNFQPLWWEDNLKKSDKISEEWGNA